MDTKNNNKLLHRMGAKKLKLTRSDGTIVQNEEVVLEQIKHKFLFGCAGFHSFSK